MNKRDRVLSLLDGQAPPGPVPAAFFMHFDPAYHAGQGAIDKHLEFFRHTDMDFVKVQFEQTVEAATGLNRPADWARAPLYPPEFFEPSVRVVAGLAQAVRGEALVIMTVYSPFMWARRVAGDARKLERHLREDPEAVRRGLEIMTENVVRLVRGCRAAGADGFYVSSQGGEGSRFPGTTVFRDYIKPTDLAVWDAVGSSPFNILHVCDYEGGYDDLTPFLDYPGHVVNCSLTVADQSLTPREAARLFGRPFMGGMERKGVIATGSADAIRRAAEAALADAPERFILAADCTVPSETAWDNLRTAVDAAHRHRR